MGCDDLGACRWCARPRQDIAGAGDLDAHTVDPDLAVRRQLRFQDGVFQFGEAIQGKAFRAAGFVIFIDGFTAFLIGKIDGKGIAPVAQ